MLRIGGWKKGAVDIDERFPLARLELLRESGVVSDVRISGQAEVSPGKIWLPLRVELSTRETCVRTLDEFDCPLEFGVNILVQMDAEGDEVAWDEDLEEDFVVHVPQQQQTLDIEEAVRQALELERPAHPIKPGAEPVVEIVETSPSALDPEESASAGPAAAEKPIDPRWEALRKLRDK